MTDIRTGAGVRQRFRIAQVAPLWMPVPPYEYGGTELVVGQLTEGLVARGHDVTLFAAPGSRTSAALRSITRSGIADAMQHGEADEYECYANALLMEALTARPAFDVVHSHLGFAHIPLGLAAPRSAVVHTLHTAVTVDTEWIMGRYAAAVIGISTSQMTRFAGRPRTWVVPHGVNPADYRGSTAEGGPLVFLGRMSARKNPVGAIDVARAAGHPIVLAGAPQDGDGYHYHRESVMPLVDGSDVTYVGAVNHERKVELLSGAGALIFPVTWDEPFGLVMIEAMMCGTPVLASRAGSTPEIVEDGLTGYVGDSIEELVELVPRVLTLDRQRVRARAIERFSTSAVLVRHEEIYRELAEHERMARL